MHSDDKPTEGIGCCSSGPWPTSPLDLNGLVSITERKLTKIQYRPHFIDGCLAGICLTIEPW